MLQQPSPLQYNKMFEMKTINSRQIPSENSKISQQSRQRPIIPFLLHRQPYKQLIVYQKKGHWTEKQKLKYAVFVEYFKKRFEIKAKRRFNNIFDLMAIFIKTRNSHQCRSHHQKMQKQKFKVDSILINTASKYHPRVYQQLKERYINQIEGLDIDEEQNFQKFRERIEKIQMKKNVQRQIMANNKRVLRSTKSSETKKQKNSKKPNETKRPTSTGKPKQQCLHRQIDEGFQRPKVKKQEQQKAQKDIKIQKPHDQMVIPPILNENQARDGNYVFNPSVQISKNEQSYCDRIHVLENNKKHHLDLAYFHYNEYIKHANEANSIQFQIMKENSLRGINYPFYR